VRGGFGKDDGEISFSFQIKEPILKKNTIPSGDSMKRMLLHSFLAFLLGGTLLFGCSKSEEAESEKGAIEKLPDRTAKKVVGKIRVPIEKARSVKEQQEDRFSDIEETLKD
jgi:hypothetical protein